jgi:catechol 2,3-dioxygenase
MPIRDPVFDPPFAIVRASHVELGVRDLARSRAFYVDCLGLLVSDEAEDALYLRGVEERNHHSIVLRRARAGEAHALCFKLASEEDLDRAAFWFGRRNLPTAFPELPYQGRTLRTADIFGMPLDLYARMDRSECMLQKYAAHQGARIQRIDHLNCFTPDVQASYDFYSELGFRLTEYTETDGSDGELWAVWLQRKGNVHDLAFTNGLGPRLHHVGLWTAGVLDEVLGHVPILQGQLTVTGTLTVRFVKPVPIERPLEARAWVDLEDKLHEEISEARAQKRQFFLRPVFLRRRSISAGPCDGCRLWLLVH